MIAEIGLISTIDHEKQGAKVTGNLKYNESVVFIEYTEIVDRLIIDVDISDYSGKSLKHRKKAIIDTGARTSSISQKTAEELGLQPVKTWTVITTTGQMESPSYMVNVYMPGGMEFRCIEVVEYPLEKHDCEVLIGMDIISRGSLQIQNTDGKTKLTFKK